jgi:hypothetical protein
MLTSCPKSIRRRILAVAIVIADGSLTALLLLVLAWPNRAVIQNASGAELSDVRLTLYDLRGKALVERRVLRLAPGASVVVRHRHNDLRAELQYTLAGKERTYDEPQIDLWAGEGWSFTVQRDGSVESRYALPTHD